MIYFTSDTHGYHKNICKGSSEWADLSGCRDFKDQYQMTEHIIENINKTVGENDILYHLGDWTFGGIKNIWNFRKQLKVKEIHLILGNHDLHLENNKILPNISYQSELGGYIVEEPPRTVDLKNLVWSNGVLAQDLFDSVQHYKEIRIDGQLIVMCHYAMRVWNHLHKGTWMLWGHSHSTLPDIGGKTMDVGVDNAYKILGEYRPFSLQEIRDIMKHRDIFFVDHHQQNKKNFNIGKTIKF